MRKQHRYRSRFFEVLPESSREPTELVTDIDNLVRDIWTQLEDPQGLSETLLKLAVKNTGLGIYLIEALDLSRQAETAYKYSVERTKMELIDKGESATAAETRAKVRSKELLDEWNLLQKNVDVLKIKRSDCDRVFDATRSRLSVIKRDMEQ